MVTAPLGAEGGDLKAFSSDGESRRWLWWGHFHDDVAFNASQSLHRRTVRFSKTGPETPAL
jgi:hypothetical protein